MKSSSGFFCAALICQGLCGLFTLLPWTRFLADSYAGYEAYPVIPSLYDGLAGKANLTGSAVFLLLASLAFTDRSRQWLYLCSFLMIVWNAAFVSWLVVISIRLENLKAYGLTFAICAGTGVVLCALTAIVAAKVAGPTVHGEEGGDGLDAVDAPD